VVVVDVAISMVTVSTGLYVKYIQYWDLGRLRAGRKEGREGRVLYTQF
jgi:hypothetical protein